MPVGKESDLELKPVPGIRIGTAAAGIKRNDQADLVVMELAPGSVCAATFTRNAFCAAPVLVARKHLSHPIRWLLINSGNANAGTGEAGLDDSLQTCRYLSDQTGVTAEQVLPFSTGVIGEPLPVEKFSSGIPLALGDLAPDGWERAARAIMTTDTRPKGVSREISIGGQQGAVTGIAKGAGMIHPNMATMLAFIATDLCLPGDVLQSCLAHSVERSFNSISVDGDTSTNDACVLVATRVAGNSEITGGSDLELFCRVLDEVCAQLAEAIVRDGEGATKLLRITVVGAGSGEEARRVGKTIATSPLVKTACFASDPNWGRILAAVGRAGVEQLDIKGVSIWLDEVLIVSKGGLAPGYREQDAQEVMQRDEIPIRVELGRGTGFHHELSCDLSYDYVRINADYRT
jgi:glutamate N-acetyltransferase/amino-acid N-acetyltransferase